MTTVEENDYDAMCVDLKKRALDLYDANNFREALPLLQSVMADVVCKIALLHYIDNYVNDVVYPVHYTRDQVISMILENCEEFIDEFLETLSARDLRWVAWWRYFYYEGDVWISFATRAWEMGDVWVARLWLNIYDYEMIQKGCEAGDDECMYRAREFPELSHLDLDTYLQQSAEKGNVYATRMLLLNRGAQPGEESVRVYMNYPSISIVSMKKLASIGFKTECRELARYYELKEDYLLSAIYTLRVSGSITQVFYSRPDVVEKARKLIKDIPKSIKGEYARLRLGFGNTLPRDTIKMMASHPFYKYAFDYELREGLAMCS